MSSDRSRPTPGVDSAETSPHDAAASHDNLGHRRCMIYRPRTISTACDQCRMSDVYCQAVHATTCCPGCTHHVAPDSDDTH